MLVSVPLNSSFTSHMAVLTSGREGNCRSAIALATCYVMTLTENIMKANI